MSKQPEALRLAHALKSGNGWKSPSVLQMQAFDELLRQHALIAELVEALETAEACIHAHGKPTDPAITAAISKAKEQS